MRVCDKHTKGNKRKEVVDRYIHYVMLVTDEKLKCNSNHNVLVYINQISLCT